MINCTICDTEISSEILRGIKNRKKSMREWRKGWIQGSCNLFCHITIEVRSDFCLILRLGCRTGHREVVSLNPACCNILNPEQCYLMQRLVLFKLSLCSMRCKLTPTSVKFCLPSNFIDSITTEYLHHRLHQNYFLFYSQMVLILGSTHNYPCIYLFKGSSRGRIRVGILAMPLPIHYSVIY